MIRARGRARSGALALSAGAAFWILAGAAPAAAYVCDFGIRTPAAGSRLSTDAATFSGPFTTRHGAADRVIEVTFTSAPGPVPATRVVVPPGDTYAVPVRPLSLNGTYTARVKASHAGTSPLLNCDDGLGSDRRDAERTAQVSFGVSVKARTPANVKATFDPAARTATVTWDSSGDPDIAGYRITRRVGTGAPTSADVPPEPRSWTDTRLPGEPATLTYAVEAARNGPSAGTTSERSAPVAAAPLDIPAPPAPPPSSNGPPASAGGPAAGRTPTTRPFSLGRQVGGSDSPPATALRLPGVSVPGGSGPVDRPYRPLLPYNPEAEPEGLREGSMVLEDSNDQARVGGDPGQDDGGVPQLAYVASGLLSTVVAAHILWIRKQALRPDPAGGPRRPAPPEPLEALAPPPPDEPPSPGRPPSDFAPEDAAVAAVAEAPAVAALPPPPRRPSPAAGAPAPASGTRATILRPAGNGTLAFTPAMPSPGRAAGEARASSPARSPGVVIAVSAPKTSPDGASDGQPAPLAGPSAQPPPATHPVAPPVTASALPLAALPPRRPNRRPLRSPARAAAAASTSPAGEDVPADGGVAADAVQLAAVPARRPLRSPTRAAAAPPADEVDPEHGGGFGADTVAPAAVPARRRNRRPLRSPLRADSVGAGPAAEAVDVVEPDAASVEVPADGLARRPLRAASVGARPAVAEPVDVGEPDAAPAPVPADGLARRPRPSPLRAEPVGARPAVAEPVDACEPDVALDVGPADGLARRPRRSLLRAEPVGARPAVPPVDVGEHDAAAAAVPADGFARRPRRSLRAGSVEASPSPGEMVPESAGVRDAGAAEAGEHAVPEEMEADPEVAAAGDGDDGSLDPAPPDRLEVVDESGDAVEAEALLEAAPPTPAGEVVAEAGREAGPDAVPPSPPVGPPVPPEPAPVGARAPVAAPPSPPVGSWAPPLGALEASEAPEREAFGARATVVEPDPFVVPVEAVPPVTVVDSDSFAPPLGADGPEPLEQVQPPSATSAARNGYAEVEAPPAPEASEPGPRRNGVAANVRHVTPAAVEHASAGAAGEDLLSEPGLASPGRRPVLFVRPRLTRRS